ncbi:hypothetical protein L1987_18507 [Smallanthus sonchifolius]|uniref:Uncharacterized protein n=1 Tax=Smallanthus sonchifolius TaxID=185202 RepID=A0ACB9IZY3_9ASTR|nr:hypothetical protein L1987_18507 [Smallanthus sonchifolius]
MNVAKEKQVKNQNIRKAVGELAMALNNTAGAVRKMSEVDAKRGPKSLLMEAMGETWRYEIVGFDGGGIVWIFKGVDLWI